MGWAGIALHFVLLSVLPHLNVPAEARKPAWTWFEVDKDRNVKVCLYLFWSQTCPHCQNALAFTDWLRQQYPWVKVQTFEISANAANRELYRKMAESLKRVGGQTPAFFYCKNLQIGYVSYEQTGRHIEASLIRWHDALKEHYRRKTAQALLAEGALALRESTATDEPLPPPPDLPVEVSPADKVYVPGWGDVQVSDLSLPMLTFVVAGCDAFNPCAFFVLLLLLSLLVHSQNRLRILVVGGIFVFFSGLVYFLFMAAWLNLFLVVGNLWLISTIAGAVAIVIGLMNTKDFFWFKRGPSLSIPESAKPGLFQRMASLIDVSSGPSLVIGAASLAVVANLYELLCTSGFPMVYTRVLTMRQLPTTTYYFYLAFYNLIYVAPMALIVLAFTVTLGARKLTEYQGRVLKLLSGTMMLTLGVVLLLAPSWLTTVFGAVSVLAWAFGATTLLVLADRWCRTALQKK